MGKFLALIIAVMSLALAREMHHTEARMENNNEEKSIFESRADRARRNLEKRWGPNEVIDGPVQAEEMHYPREPQIDPQDDFGTKEGSVD
jgi:hypothetical protein